MKQDYGCVLVIGLMLTVHKTLGQALGTVLHKLVNPQTRESTQMVSAFMILSAQRWMQSLSYTHRGSAAVTQLLHV